MVKNIESLSQPAKKWLAHAIVGMVVADKVVTAGELDDLKSAVGFLGSRQEVEEMLAYVKKRERPPLQILKLERGMALEILKHLARVTVLDDKLTKTEVDFFRYAGMRLGFDRNFCQEVVLWAMDLLSAHKREALLNSMAANTMPTYEEYQ